MSTLTRVQLPIRLASVRRRLSSPQVMHAIVQAAGAGDGGRTLWRVDGTEPEFTLYVVSPGDVDAELLCSELGLPSESVQSRDYAPVLGALEVGQEWRFRLRANPVKALARDGRRSAIHALRTQPEQLEWLQRKAKAAGFSIPLNRLGLPEVVTAARDAMLFKGSTQSRVSIETVVFDGILKVTDERALRSAMLEGIGRAKAYGCGLLTLAPVVS